VSGCKIVFILLILVGLLIIPSTLRVNAVNGAVFYLWAIFIQSGLLIELDS